MAEILIPALGLGMLYIVSNQNKKESYTNIGANTNKLPNTYLKESNYDKKDFYPHKLNNLFKNKKVTDNIRKFKSQKDDTKQYFSKTYQSQQNKKNYENREFTSLTGENVEAGSLKHNNMVPFFGSKIRQPLSNHRVTENILDNYTGSGSQHIEKKVVAPFFKPQKDMHWGQGMPNHNDFIQNRMNVSHKISGVRPFEQEYVAPGLDRGYGSEGHGGFNSGMAARDKWMPKNVDQLRTITNPKLSFEGQFLGAKASVQNRGIQPDVEKQRPDRYFEVSPDRWFTTTGIEKRETQRAEELLKEENRSTTTKEYYGASYDQNNNASYTNRNYLSDKRQDLPTNPLGNASRSNVWDSDKNDYGREGFSVLPNSRSLTGETNTMGNISRGMWALATPVMDMLRPSRKTNVIGNLRPIGNAKGPQEPKIYNRHQPPKSTIKERYEENKYIPMGMHAHNGGYTTNEIQVKGQQRTSTQEKYIGNISSSSRTSKPENYSQYNNVRINNKDLLSYSRTNPGNMKLVNNNINMCTRKDPLICPEPLRPPKMPISTPNVSALGQQSYKITRGQFGNHDRTDSTLVSALNSNPFSKPLGSVA